VQNLSSCCLPSTYGIVQGFSNYGLRPQGRSRNEIWGWETNWLDKSDITIFAKFTRKLEVGLQWIYFCCIFIFRGNIVFYAVSCLLWCLPELSNDNKNQAQQVMRCYTTIVLTYWPILALLHSFRHEGMLLFRL